jgi:hypothetical protein
MLAALTHALQIQQFYCKVTELIILVHRVSDLENGLLNSCEKSLDKSLDVFVSYRRSNGSQLARCVNGAKLIMKFCTFLKNLPLNPILNHVNRVYTLTPWFLRIHLNIIDLQLNF